LSEGGKGITLYIVDYDLSLSLPSQRRAFYRSLHKILKSVSRETGWSTQSVIVIEDRTIAESIFELARGLGSVHLYQGEKIR
jgi:hypothetical protein